MKNLVTRFIFSVLVLFICFAGTTTVVDEVLQIPYTSEAPTIDGTLDDVWKSVTAIPMLLLEGAPLDTVGVFDDHFSSFRVMWDDDYLYFFAEIVDDERDGSDKASPWMNDAIELFLDGGNEKASSYDANDIQWRWVYGETAGDTSNAGNGPGDFIFVDTEVGYNLEGRISADDLSTYFALESDTEIGFEISNADRDNGDRDEVSHWWTNDGNTWADASLFGTALLVEKEVNGVINIPYAETDPTIDGVFEDGEGWEIADELSLTLFEGGSLPDTILATWKDHLSSVWTMWNEDNLYLFVKVTDDELDGSDKAAPWMNDAVELFLDGGNEKASSYDANDIQWRWVYGEVEGDTSNAGNGPGNFVFADTDDGYNLEIKIPAADLADYFALEADTEIGFEVSNADRDNGDREHVRHWWTMDGNTWADASLFGTAVLYQDGETAIEIEEISNVPQSFELSQNYPNPFNPTTTFNYSLAEASSVELAVYNLAGQRVALLEKKNKSAGTYKVTFDGSNLSSGVYFYRLTTNNNIFTKKMMLLK